MVQVSGRILQGDLNFEDYVAPTFESDKTDDEVQAI